MNSPRALPLVGAVIGFGVVAGAGATLLLRGPPSETTGPERLLDASFYRRSQSLYHVADVQRRPRVKAAIEGLRAVNLCEFIFKMETSKMNSDMTYGKPCQATYPEDRHWDWNDALRFDPQKLWKTYSAPPFAVLVDSNRTPYLFALGKNGSQTADELETLVVTVLEAATASAPQVLEERARARELEAQQRHDAEERQRRAAESFK